MEITNAILTNYIDTTLTISVAFVGVGFALFTLFYAFIGNKKDEIKTINEEIKQNGNSITILRRKNSALNFINHMRNFNSYTIAITIISLTSTILTIILKYTFEYVDNKVYPYISITLLAIVISLFILLIILMYKILKHYKQYNSI